MADIFNVHFKVGGEAVSVSFEYRENAVRLADILNDDVKDFRTVAHVTDEFGETDENDYPVPIYPEDYERSE